MPGAIIGVGLVVVAGTGLRQGRPQARLHARRRASALLFAFPAAWLVQTGDHPRRSSAAFVGGLGLIYGCVYGPLAAFWSELFDTRYRYSALSTLYQVSGIVASGLTPLIAAWLVTWATARCGWWRRTTSWSP